MEAFSVGVLEQATRLGEGLECLGGLWQGQGLDDHDELVKREQWPKASPGFFEEHQDAEVQLGLPDRRVALPALFHNTFVRGLVTASAEI